MALENVSFFIITFNYCMEKSWFMSLESVFTLQLAKTFLVSEVQPSLLVREKAGMVLVCFVLIVPFRLKFDNCYIQLECWIQEDQRTNSPVVHLQSALALHPFSGSTDFNLPQVK